MGVLILGDMDRERERERERERDRDRDRETETETETETESSLRVSLLESVSCPYNSPDVILCG